MTALIIEDEYLAAERLQKLIQKVAPDCQVVSTVGSIEKAVEWLENNPQPTLIFSDIQLSDGLSFEIFDTVLVKSPIIFTTSYDEYAIKAFKVKSIDYLLKPIKIQDLEKAIQKYKDLHQEALTQQLQKIETLIDTIHSPKKPYKSRFLVKQNDQLLPINQDDIAYFFTANEMVCLVHKDGKQFLVDYTLEDLENLLNPKFFFRLNRQFIAHIQALQKIHTYFNGKLKLELRPIPSQEVLVSREKALAFKQWVEAS